MPFIVGHCYTSLSFSRQHFDYWPNYVCLAIRPRLFHVRYHIFFDLALCPFFSYMLHFGAVFELVTHAIHFGMFPGTPRCCSHSDLSVGRPRPAWFGATLLKTAAVMEPFGLRGRQLPPRKRYGARPACITVSSMLPLCLAIDVCLVERQLPPPKFVLCLY